MHDKRTIAYEESERTTLYRMEDEEKQGVIIQTAADLIQEKSEKGIPEEDYADKYGYAGYTMLKVAENVIIIAEVLQNTTCIRA